METALNTEKRTPDEIGLMMPNASLQPQRRVSADVGWLRLLDNKIVLYIAGWTSDLDFLVFKASSQFLKWHRDVFLIRSTS